MALLRAFLASEIPSPIQDGIQTATNGLRRELGNDVIRWVPAYNIHLTLKFLGDVSESSLAMVKQMLTTEAAQYEVFNVQVEGFGCFPNARRPRVLWVGLQAPPTLAALQHSVDAFAARLGYRAEERGYSPHLTIGRIRQDASSANVQKIRCAVEQTKIGVLGTIQVRAVNLFKSELHSSGSVYTKLFSAPLIEHG